MATNFPGSLDSFSNPSAGSSLSSPSHSAQHANVNDAVEAIETALLDGAPLKIDDANNRVGIGTASPDRVLHVDSSTAATVAKFASQHASLGLVELEDASSTATSQIGTSGNDIVFRPIQSERMRIDSSGKVGIGTTSPVDLLDVGDATTAGSFRVHATGGGESFRVTGTVVRSTNIVNLTTASAANVFINTANNSIYRSTSSAKYKTDIETLDAEHADIVFQLRPVWYRSTTGNDPEGWSYYGLIAEEVAGVDPRLVHFGAAPDCGCVEDDDGRIEHEPSCLTEPEGVQYDRLVPHLINVVQRQQAQIDTLTARIEALEAG